MLVKFMPGLTEEKRKQIITQYDCKILEYIESIDLYRLKVKNKKKIHEIVGILNKDIRTEYAELNYTYSPNEKLTETLSGVFSILKDKFINFLEKNGVGIILRPNPEEIYKTADNKYDNYIKVAVIDTGVDYTHPELREKICINKGEIPNNKKDDDNNGYVDDIIGWDFDLNNNNPAHITGKHGTHVAGIIARSAGNNVRIMPIRIGKEQMTSDKAAQAIKYAVDNGADVINLSIGGQYLHSNTLHNAISFANKKGVIIISSSGNDGNIALHYPAAYKEVISVGAVDYHGNLYIDTNRGPGVDIYAPGVDVYSTYPNKRHGVMTGTSMAVPYVSGTVARIKQKNPLLNSTEIRNIIKDTAGINEIYDNSSLEVVVKEKGIHLEVEEKKYNGSYEIRTLNPEKAISAAPTVEQTITDLYLRNKNRKPTQQEMSDLKEKVKNKEIVKYDDKLVKKSEVPNYSITGNITSKIISKTTIPPINKKEISPYSPKSNFLSIQNPFTNKSN
ncbi:MAG: S8 family peptidase [Elusimicrobiota bacterium]